MSGYQSKFKFESFESGVVYRSSWSIYYYH